MAPLRPKVAFVTAADAHKVGDRAKVDALGLFTTLGVWGVPAQRECSLIIGVDDLPAGNTPFSVWLRSPGGRSTQVGAGTITRVGGPGNRTLLAHRIHLVLARTGSYGLGVSLGSHKTPRNAAWFPLVVHDLPWPERPSPDRLAAALADPTTIKAVRVVLECRKCHRKYTFEIQLDPNAKLSRGSLPFPPDGTFRCPACDSVHHLRDVEGQLRSQLGRPGGPVGAA